MWGSRPGGLHVVRARQVKERQRDRVLWRARIRVSEGTQKALNDKSEVATFLATPAARDLEVCHVTEADSLKQDRSALVIDRPSDRRRTGAISGHVDLCPAIIRPIELDGEFASRHLSLTQVQ